MATDVARLSFDSGRMYTGVVPQQGRVSLEAEQNEQRVIDAVERREELLDIVGPAGTPDDGYAVSIVGGAVTLGAGTMYVGGVRVELDAPVSYLDQPDWLDRPDIRKRGRGGHVLLLLRETDVTAVEDPMLYEPALGGPDGAARTRLLQHIEIAETDATTCAGALEEDERDWAQQGATFDPTTMALESNGRLLVTWEGSPEPDDPCEPSSTGGFLGAENQLIRVQIVDYDEDDGTFSIVWGYDDASMLYRVTAGGAGGSTLSLERSPVDDYHRPRAGQAVQMLRATAVLASSDGAVEGYVAALDGLYGVLTTPYDPDTKTVPFPSALPASYTDETQNPQLYLRVWEELISGNELDSPITLTGTGMQVTVSLDGGGIPRIGDFWCIGVRPGTPTTVYPDRLLRTPQPPDGPREWVCPLAVVGIANEDLSVIADCRVHFPPLTGIAERGCCTIEVEPADAASGALQSKIDSAAAGRVLGDRAGRITVCFSAGRYELAEPVRLQRTHSNITLQACTQGAVISIEGGKEEGFTQGMFVLNDVDNVTITGFEFELPQVPAADVRIAGASGSTFGRKAVLAINELAASHYVSIAIRPVNCAVLEVSECIFRFSLGENQTTAEDSVPRSVFGIGIFAAGGAWGLRLQRNQFRHHPEVPVFDEKVHRVMVGYLLTPSAGSGREVPKRTQSVGLAHLPALLDAAEISDNTFDGITVPVLVLGVLGSIQIWDNVVHHCYGGFWVLDVTSTANTDLIGSYETPGDSPEAIKAAHNALSGLLLDQTLVFIVTLAEIYPLPLFDDWSIDGLHEFTKDQLSSLRRDAKTSQRTWMQSLVGELSTGYVASTDNPTGANGAPANAEVTEVTEAATSTTTTKTTKTTKVSKDAIAAAPVRVVFNPPQEEPVGYALTALPSAYADAWAAVSELERIAPDPARLDTTVWIERNAIDCRSTVADTSGPAVFVYTLQNQADSAATAIVSSNRVVTPQVAIAVAVLGTRWATLTGNVVATTAIRVFAMAVALIPEVAITGNVVRGRTLLPANRPFAAPLDTWQPLNTING
jgi:hypothetical protein